MRDAKRLYSEKLHQQFSANDSASVWRGLREITSYKPKAPHSIDDLCLANSLNPLPFLKKIWDSPDSIPCDPDCSKDRIPAKQPAQTLSLPPPWSTMLISCLWCSQTSSTLGDMSCASLLQDLHHHPGSQDWMTTDPSPRPLWSWSLLSALFCHTSKPSLTHFWTPCSAPTEATGL